MARTYSRAGLKSQARSAPGGSTVYWWALRPRTASARTAAGPSPSDRQRRWSFVDQRRCCLGGRGEFCRQATIRSCACWTSIGTLTSTSRASLKAAPSSRQLLRPAAWSRSRLGRLLAPTSLSCVTYFAEAVGAAAKFLAQPDGPRVGALALNGWDTHYNE